MTDREMREQKVRLRIDVEDSEKHLAHLHEKARRRAEMIIQFGKWLKESPELNIYRDNYSTIHGQPVERIVPLTDDYIQALEIKPSLELANEIREETETLRKLREILNRL
jgi:hypothetical protein